MNNNKLKLFMLLLALAALTACGGGSEGETNSNTSPPPANVAPTANAGADINVSEGDNVSLAGSASDQDGSISTYVWEQVSGPAVTLLNNNSATANFIAPEVVDTANSTFRFTVTDDDGESNSDDIDVTIENINVETIGQAINQLESTGQLPTLNNDSTLSGPDNDHNGIRDDIDDFIVNESIDSSKKDALKLVASSIQTVISSDLNDSTIIEQASDDMALAMVCLTSKFSNPADAYKYLKKIEGYTANTQERATKYNLYNAKMDGTVTRLPNASNCQ